MIQYKLVLSSQQFDENKIRSVIDESVAYVLNEMEKISGDIPDFMSSVEINILIGGLESFVDNESIYIGEIKNNSLGKDNFLFMLVSHELSHIIIEKYFNKSGPVLFWEGIPIYFADFFIRKKIMGVCYHEISSYLMSHNKLIASKNLFDPNIYYMNRADRRVDVEAGSLIGFLMETKGASAIKAFYDDYIAPTSENPRIDTNKIALSFGFPSWNDLELSWYTFLGKFSNDKSEYASFLDPAKAIHPSKHCVFCYSFLEEQDESICPQCKSPNPTHIEIL